MMYKVIGTNTYLKEIEKWSKEDKETVQKLPNKLASNPYTGDQLSYKFLREKRIGEKRVYYLIYDELELVLIVATSGKKDQQATIDHIKEQFEEYKEIAQKISKQVS